MSYYYECLYRRALRHVSIQLLMRLQKGQDNAVKAQNHNLPLKICSVAPSSNANNELCDLFHEIFLYFSKTVTFKLNEKTL